MSLLQPNTFISAYAFSNQYVISISRYLAVAVVRCSCASCPAETLRGGWLHTGDMATRDEDGFFTIVDRKKDMIVSGGFNVFPREIEDVLSSVPAVAMCAVVGVPDDKWGEAVKALVVRKLGAEVTAAELIALVKEKKGPVYAPKSVDFVDAIPLTAVGKADKKALRAMYWSGQERLVH